MTTVFLAQLSYLLFIMKLLFSILVLGTFCTDTANSYIASSPAGAEWNNAKSFAQPPANVEVDGIFREEYHEWAKLYGKSTSDRIRFENFKLNFMLQMQHNKKTGTFNLLNEFGDMTATEFNLGNELKKNDDNDAAMPTTNPKQSTNNVVEVELIVDKTPIPKVRMLDSESIPRITAAFGGQSTKYAKPRNRQQAPRNAQKVSLESSVKHTGFRDQAPTSRPRSYASRDQVPGPRVYGNQDQVIGQMIGPLSPPRKKRRLARLQVGPDKIL